MRKEKKSRYIFIDLVIISFSFFFIIWLKPATKRIYFPQYFLPFIFFVFLWIILSFLFDKFNFKNKLTIKHYISPIFKTSLTSLAIILSIIFLFDLLHYSRLIVLGTIILCTALELFFLFILFLHRKIKGDIDFSDRFTKRISLLDDQDIDQEITSEYSFPDLKNIDDSISRTLVNKYLIRYKELYKFILANINLNGIIKTKSSVVKTHTLYNIEHYDLESQQLFINLHKINDIRRINRFFIQVNKNLQFGGYFVGSAETIKERYQRYKKKYPIIVFHIMYGLSFLFTRVFPKIPILKEIYFVITKGNNRQISKAEILGRLSYCGFSIISEIEVENLFYFIAQKVRKYEENEVPTYGPLIKLRRVGREGKSIYIYKLRSMHPYSEYLQKYICDIGGGTIDGDGFKKDFRITSWGRILRKFWIDELPMFVNFFRSDLKLVGIRPLSYHKYCLYSDKMKKLRVQFKPGIIPPFYADLPKNLAELEKSEYNYLIKYQQRPLRTDFEYFFKVWFNILFKGVRSK